MMMMENSDWINERQEAQDHLLEIAEMSIIMHRLVSIFDINATVVDVNDHPEYRRAQARLSNIDGGITKSFFGPYEEQ